jgi:hypothetical protein
LVWTGPCKLALGGQGITLLDANKPQFTVALASGPSPVHHLASSEESQHLLLSANLAGQLLLHDLREQGTALLVAQQNSISSSQGPQKQEKVISGISFFSTASTVVTINDHSE